MLNNNALTAAGIIGQNIGVSPSIIYGQFVAEGTTNGLAGGANGNYNYGNIMPNGQLAQYNSPQAFAQAYTQLIQKNFPNAVGTGTNINAFVSGLTNSNGQIYYGTGISAGQYAKNIKSGSVNVITPSNIPPSFSLSNLPAYLSYEAKNIGLFAIGFIFIYIVLKNSLGKTE